MKAGEKGAGNGLKPFPTVVHTGEIAFLGATFFRRVGVLADPGFRGTGLVVISAERRGRLPYDWRLTSPDPQFFVDIVSPIA